MSICAVFTCLIMLQLVVSGRAFRLLRPSLISRRQVLRSHGGIPDFGKPREQKDCLLTGLNGAQDISVKVLSCKDVLQEMLTRNELSPVAAKHLGELVACSLMMGAGLKGEEVLQLNFVGNAGIKNIIAISDGNLNVRGTVGNPQFAAGVDVKNVHMSDLLGEGQVQIIRNHPAWKHPMNGITALRPVSIATNLAYYMVESEQRPSAMITDVQVEGDRVVSALGLMIETLPGASSENIETSIANLEAVQKKGLQTYVTEFLEAQKTTQLLANSTNETADDMTICSLSGNELSPEQRSRAEDLFASLDSPLEKILDDCMVSMDSGSLRWDKKPTFKCTCDANKVWRALKLLAKSEIQEIVNKQEDVKMKCEFCGEKYVVTTDQIHDKILAQPAPEPEDASGQELQQNEEKKTLE